MCIFYKGHVYNYDKCEGDTFKKWKQIFITVS